ARHVRGLHVSARTGDRCAGSHGDTPHVRLRRPHRVDPDDGWADSSVDVSRAWCPALAGRLNLYARIEWTTTKMLSMAATETPATRAPAPHATRLGHPQNIPRVSEGTPIVHPAKTTAWSDR